MIIFLTKATTKDIYYTISQTRRNALTAASNTYMQSQQQQMGNRVRFYWSPEGDLYSIGEYDSLQDYSQRIWGAPRSTGGFTDFECVPLLKVDFSVPNPIGGATVFPPTKLAKK